MKISLPRSMALKVAEYLESDAEQLESSYWDPAVNRVTPRDMRLEVERVRKWVAQIRTAASRKRLYPPNLQLTGKQNEQTRIAGCREVCRDESRRR